MAEIGGIKGRVNIDGTRQRPVFDILLSAKGDDAICWFSDPSKKYDNELMLSSRIEKKDGIYIGSSLLSIQKEKIVSEVNFDWKGSNKNDVDIQFSSKNFSGEFFSFFLMR